MGSPNDSEQIVADRPKRAQDLLRASELKRSSRRKEIAKVSSSMDGSVLVHAPCNLICLRGILASTPLSGPVPLRLAPPAVCPLSQ